MEKELKNSREVNTSFAKFQRISRLSVKQLDAVRKYLEDNLEEIVETASELKSQERNRKIYNLAECFLEGISYEDLMKLYPGDRQLSDYLTRILTINKML